MRLKQIKIAGFKSFVDVTTIPLKHTMTAIVGPNGCGKSNIIDAVRWVLGESSAKNLRGDAMSDVIFNGASGRKPISQASVELIFENVADELTNKIKSDNTNTTRNEIAIRRLVNRDGTNQYFLNGTKCRRRDITDIFLGTGLGPRSYAIIEQGTISKLIESKPQELRVFIEEAAGISKYKERRKETETSIRHTQENLVRLNDIRAELTLQIDKLHQQAEAAKRFVQLKQQERQYKAELSAMRWQQFDKKCQTHQKQCAEQETQIAALTLTHKQHQFELDKSKQHNHGDDQTLQAYQQEKLQLTSKIASVEQSIKYNKQQQCQFEKTVVDIEHNLITLNQSLKADNDNLSAITDTFDQNSIKLTAVMNEIELKSNVISDNNEIQKEFQNTWQHLLKQKNSQQEQHNTLQNKITYQQNVITQNEQKITELTQQVANFEQKIITFNTLTQDETLRREEQKKLASLEQQKLTAQNQMKRDKKLIDEKSQFKAKQQGIIEGIQRQIESLNLQLSGKSEWEQKQQQWLDAIGITTEGLLYQVLEIEPKWQIAIEQVLSYWLQAALVETIPDFQSSNIPLPADILLVQHTSVSSIADETLINKGTLSALLDNSGIYLPQFNNVFLAENYSQAQTLLPTLATHQSVLCPDGTWLGNNFLIKGNVETTAPLSLLQKENELHHLRQQLTDVKMLEQENDSELQQIVNRLEQWQAEALNQETGFQAQQQLLWTLDKDIALKHQESLNLAQQKEAFILSLQQLKMQIENDNNALDVSIKEQAALIPLDKSLQDQTDIEEKLTALQVKMSNEQLELKQLQDSRHDLAINVEQHKAQQQKLATSIEQNQHQIDQFSLQQQQNKDALFAIKSPLLQEQEQLSQWLTKIVTLDDTLQQFHVKQTEIAQTLLMTEKQKVSVEESLNNAKAILNKEQIAFENNKIRAQSCIDQIIELKENLTDVLGRLPNHATEVTWQALLIKCAKDINQLGAINLAAISEYEQQLKRKQYLDQQNDDLVDALSTLASAISTIDKESRQKFKVTFERVNQDLQKLFPKVFGGGHAYLALTDDDLLESGVSIMARPPGKKNSTIHLLSGGEKALTALSLVFAIFRLNPAPFCLLDEVDAPLDDINVERFCHLVEEMSQTVQFIYISHNKIAMEMASHLTGITMFEPGVSKMVAVDINEAIAMAELS